MGLDAESLEKLQELVRDIIHIDRQSIIFIMGAVVLILFAFALGLWIGYEPCGVEVKGYIV